MVGVTVFNDENALGFPESGSNYSTFPGALLLGVSWADTATSVQSRYPAGDVSGDCGAEVVLSYLQDDYRFDIALLARHADQMLDSPIHSITVTRLTASSE